MITVSTFRDGPSAVYGNFGGLTDGKETLQGGGPPASAALRSSSPRPMR